MGFSNAAQYYRSNRKYSKSIQNFFRSNNSSRHRQVTGSTFLLSALVTSTARKGLPHGADEARALPYGCKRLVKREGLLVAFCLHRISVAQFEGRTGNKAGAATQRERDGDGVKALALGIANRDGFVLRDVKTNEQYGRLLG